MLGAVGWVAGLVCAFPRETVAIHDLTLAGRIEEAREIYRWFMPLLHLDVSHRFVQNIKVAEQMVRGTSTVVRAPRLELEGAELARVRRSCPPRSPADPTSAATGFEPRRLPWDVGWAEHPRVVPGPRSGTRDPEQDET